jgi:2-haloacid dehalogenase
MTHPHFTNIDACLFDAYGTLFDVHSAVAKESAALGDKAQAVSATWRDKQLQYTWLRSLMGEHTDFWQVTGDALDYALASQGVEDAGLRQRLMDLYLTLDTYPEVPGALKRIRDSGRKTAILSNGEPRMLASAVDSAGIKDLLDDVITVEAVGIYKPDPRVYGLGAERSGAPAERICFVSSNAWDVHGAANFGFNCAWINRFGQQRERLPGTPKAEVRTMDEVAELLGL